LGAYLDAGMPVLTVFFETGSNSEHEEQLIEAVVESGVAAEWRSKVVFSFMDRCV